MKIKNVFYSMVAMLATAMPAFAQLVQPNAPLVQPNAPLVDQQQQFAQYQMWFQNADMQLRQQTAGMSPVMQLQASVNAIRGELAQWGSFLQRYYPAVYATRCAELQQRTQKLMMLKNGGGMPVQSARPFPRVSSGGGYARRCIACRGSGMCKQCTGTGTVHASYGGSGSWTCTSCKGSGKCSICNRYEIRRLD